MNDRETIELLDWLARYFDEYGPDLPSPDKMTVTEVVTDLLGSLGQEQLELVNRTKDYSSLAARS